MGWFSRRKTLATLGTGLSALAGCASVGISNPFSGAVEVRDIDVRASNDAAPEPMAGVESTIVVTVVNPGGASAEEEVTLAVDGETVETVEVSLDGDGRDHRYVEYTFEETGGYVVTAGDYEGRVEITEEVEFTAIGDAGGKFVAAPDGTRGLVSVWVRVFSDSEFPFSYEPPVEIDGEPVEQFHHDGLFIQEPSGEFDGEIEPHGNVGLVAQVEVEIDDTYEVTFDGDSLGPVSLEREPLTARYGETDRAGPSVPRGVVGSDPEIVERFPVEKPDGPDDYMDLEKMETMAVTEDRLYMRFRWGNYFHSLAAYDRWSGEEYWQEEIGNPADLVVIEDTEYLLGGGTLTARSADGDELWQREVEVDGYATESALGVPDSALMAPTEDRLYVGLPDEVAVFDRESGERERRLDGQHTALAGDAVYTWDQGTARRYERGSDRPVWTADLDTAASAGLRFTPHGMATEDAVVLVSHVRDGEDTRFLLHCYDGENGEERWTKTIVGTIPEGAFDIDKVVPAEGISVSDTGSYVMPDVTQPILVERGAMWDEQLVYVGSTAGCRGYELESGEEIPQAFENNGTNPTIGRVDIGYFGSYDGLYVVPPGVRGGTDAEGVADDDGLAVELPEEMKWESHQITSQFGYDCLYLPANGYVNVISGTVPEWASNAEGTDGSDDE